MRRRDREVSDPAKIREIIAACHCCRLGFADGGKIYIVPLNFGYQEEDGQRTFFFHSAPEGRKIDLIEKTHYAGFELDAHYQLTPRHRLRPFRAVSKRHRFWQGRARAGGSRKSGGPALHHAAQHGPRGLVVFSAGR